MKDETKPSREKVKPAKKQRVPVTAADIRKAASEARDKLAVLAKNLQDTNALLDKVSKEDANFSTRDSLRHLLTFLDAVNLKDVIKQISRMHSERLLDRARE